MHVVDADDPRDAARLEDPILAGRVELLELGGFRSSDVPAGPGRDGGRATEGATVPAVRERVRNGLRAMSRKLPITGAYERRIAELTAEVERLAAEVHELADRVPAFPAPDLWVPAGHFYSPLPDLDEIRADRERIFPTSPADVTDLPAIDLGIDEQWALHEQLAPLADDIELVHDQETATASGLRYWADNPGYPPGDARSLTMMLRHLRPQRLVELGSGYSSACTLDARDHHLDGRLDLTFVDPYPALLTELLRDDDRTSCRILPVRTQDVELDVFAQLGPGDVLFVDSTHVARTGSDVNRIVFDILPSLAPGVYVHLHDIFPGFEYPEPWVMEGRAWTEQYLLRAFLQHNERFRVVWWPSLLHMIADDAQRQRFGGLPLLQGGAIWLRTV